MRRFCYCLFPLVLVSCPVLSRAATIRASDPNFTYVSSTPDSFMFTACPTTDPYQDRGVPVTGDGCFGGINASQGPITEIELTFQNTQAIQDSGPALAQSDIFANATVIAPTDPTDPNEFYTYVFSGNELSVNQPFVIVEDGVDDPSEFPTVTLTYSNSNSVTPEPSSALLLATGLGCVAIAYRRRFCA
jgi:hypothetical protein